MTIKINFSEDDKAYLEKIRHSPYVLSYKSRGSHVLLLIDKGINISSASKLAGLSRATAYKWINRFNKNGIACINSYINENPKKEDDVNIKSIIISLLHAPPKDHGINRTSWRLKDLKTCIHEKGIIVSLALISRVLKKSGYRWLKAKTVLTSDDPDYRKKIDKIQSVLRNLEPGGKFFSIDEFGPFSVKMRKGRKLIGPKEYNIIPQYQKSKGSLILTAALELGSNQISYFYSEHKNTKEMIKLVNLLLKKYAKCKYLFLSWDAAPWHSSKTLLNFIKKINTPTCNEKHKKPQIIILTLPKNAQFLNVIESIFSSLAKSILHNSNYRTVQECKQAINCKIY
ncbi:IS630 family transposase [candidate division KSB1 bacterium]